MSIDFFMNKFSVIIVNYKSDELTVSYVLDELPKVSSDSYSVVVVNNAATDDSNNFLSEKLSAPVVDSDDFKDIRSQVVIISSPDNLGFAKGNNLGASYAIEYYQPQYILFSNTDIKIETLNIVDLLILKIDQKEDIGMVGPNCKDIEGVSQSPLPYTSFFKRYFSTIYSVLVYGKKRHTDYYKSSYPQIANEGIHYKISGCFFIVKTKEFVNCGMMDPYTFLYCEEEILTERMKLINKHPYYVPQYSLVHEESKTIGKFNSEYKKRQLALDSKLYYYGKYKKINPLILHFARLVSNMKFFINSVFKKG